MVKKYHERGLHVSIVAKMLADVVKADGEQHHPRHLYRNPDHHSLDRLHNRYRRGLLSYANDSRNGHKANGSESREKGNGDIVDQIISLRANFVRAFRKQFRCPWPQRV